MEEAAPKKAASLTFAPERRGLENLVEAGSQPIRELSLWV
jgi:hypothetical protein